MARTGNELGAFLRARRATRTPASVGLPGGGRRRSPGLRREELAALAGVSVDYLVRLEQGRQRDPSPQVLRALADALALTDDLRRHLLELAGRTDPQPVDPAVHVVPAAVRRLVLGAQPSPAWVLNRRRDIVAWNAPAEALLGPLGQGSNYLRLLLRPGAGVFADGPVVLEDAVAGLRAATAPAAAHPQVLDLVRDLAEEHPGFARLWAERDVRASCSTRREVDHPVAGRLCFEVQLLDVAGGDLQLVLLDPAEACRERWTAFLAGRDPAARRLRLA